MLDQYYPSAIRRCLALEGCIMTETQKIRTIIVNARTKARERLERAHQRREEIRAAQREATLRLEKALDVDPVPSQADLLATRNNMTDALAYQIDMINWNFHLTYHYAVV